MLVAPYQFVEVIIGTLLFIPLFYLYLRITNEVITTKNILLTTIFVGIILISRYIGMNYTILTETSENR